MVPRRAQQRAPWRGLHHFAFGGQTEGRSLLLQPALPLSDRLTSGEM